MKILRALFILLLAATMLPALAVPEKTPLALKLVALAFLVIGLGVWLNGRFRMWKALSDDKKAKMETTQNELKK